MLDCSTRIFRSCSSVVSVSVATRFIAVCAVVFLTDCVSQSFLFALSECTGILPNNVTAAMENHQSLAGADSSAGTGTGTETEKDTGTVTDTDRKLQE